MIRNLLKSAYRNLLKNKGFTFLNIFGLTLGLTSFLFIAIYVFYELGYDRYNVNADRIYRVNTDLKITGNVTKMAISSNMVGLDMKNEFPDVERVTRISMDYGVSFLKRGENIIENRGALCDPSIFDIFTLPLLYGTKQDALKEPNSIVISETLAKKYFDTADAIGRTLYSKSDTMTYKVTGVMKDIPEQSHFIFDFLLPLKNNSSDYNGIGQHTYILVKKGTNLKVLESKFPAFMAKHLNKPSFSYD